MSIVVNNARKPDTGAMWQGSDVFSFHVCLPLSAKESMDRLIAKCNEKHGGYMRLVIDKPFVPKTTGERSINNRIHGHCEDIAEQLSDPRYDQDTVYRAMKRMSVSEGYPTQLSIDGVEEPKSMADASEEEALIVNRVIQRYADMHGFWLTEYDDSVKPPVPFRSLGGRTRQEMDTYNTGRT